MAWIDTRCPQCGRQIAEHNLDGHLEDCSGDEERDFDGECPLCGDRYESYTRHVLGVECES